MSDKYYRLICFVVNLCPELLRDIFLKHAKSDDTTYTTLPTYLATKNSEIKKMLEQRQIREDQFFVLYPVQGNTDESDWDVSLLVTLIIRLFKAKLSPVEKYYINEIREVRNDLQHLPDTARLSDDDFDTYWGRLETATTTLAKQIFGLTYETSFKKKSSYTKTNHLPDLGDHLRVWYEEIIKQLSYKFENFTETLKDISTDTRSTTSLMQSVTIAEPGNSENKRHRLRVPDSSVLSHLQVRFEKSINALQDCFSASREILEIQRTLKEKHYAVIAGTYNSQCSEIALAAVKGMSYNHKRCVEIHRPSDWRLISPEDVDLVIFRDPFGSTSYDESKASSMAENFDSMLQITKENGGDETIHIVIITDFTVLGEVKQRHDHDILEDVVNVFGAATEEHPADLTLESGRQVSCFSSTHNLPVMTKYFLDQYKSSSELVKRDILQTARDTFKKNKSVVIAGPKRCGKTSVAVALASSYKPSECLLLTGPSDVKKIDFSRECLIIIDEFAGKYRYDENVVYNWYEMFDLLNTVLSNGKINVVATSETSKLERCCEEINIHPLLEHRVDLTENCIVLKRKIKTEVHENSKRFKSNSVKILQSGSSISRAKKLPVWSADAMQTDNIRATGDRRACYIKGACMLPSGKMLIADWENKNIKKLDDKYMLISVCNLSDCPYSICYIGNNKAVAALRGKQLQFVDVREMTRTKTMKTNHLCKGLTYHDNQLYVIDHKSVYVYSTSGKMLRVLFTCTSQNPNPDFRHLEVSYDGSKIYIANFSEGLVTIDSSGKTLYTFTDSKLPDICGVCVDGAGHVLVCGQLSKIALKISGNGKQKLGIICNQSGDAICGDTIFFDKRNVALVTAGKSCNMSVFKL
ncbi:uncharacterized protein LOC128550859 [Mercenaria mercenaria]|uniref:uncharacterized protein LOC128550859 n=1 Tax=Mercenaria mercenaria TaxID=6596 RepID=UPI00234EE7EA|nr:uncharacterized protein LOC128550859 [Mercenaria mercenaria]